MASVEAVPFKAKVLHSYEPIETKEIALLSGSVINVIRTHNSGWWKGEYNGRTGWFPSTFVRPISGAAGTSVAGIAKETETAAPSAPAPGMAPTTPPTLTSAESRKKKTFLRQIRAFFTRKGKGKTKTKKPAAAPAALTPVFGMSMSDVCARDECASGIPVFLDRAMEFLWEHGLGLEGLFRVPCLKSALDATAAEIDNDSTGIVFSIEKHNTELVGGLVKLFLRKHPETFFPSELYRPLMNLASLSREERIEKTSDLFHDPRIPECNMRFFLRFTAFLYEAVTNHVETMKMTPEGYGTVFGPVLFTDDVTNQMGINLADISTHIAQMVFCIKNWPELAERMGCDIRGHYEPGSGPQAGAEVSAASEPAGADQTIVTALFDYQATTDVTGDTKHIDLTTGDELVVERRAASGWLKGYKVADPSVRGWFPGSYVK